jgi:hypothetical protein
MTAFITRVKTHEDVESPNGSARNVYTLSSIAKRRNLRVERCIGKWGYTTAFITRVKTQEDVESPNGSARNVYTLSSIAKRRNLRVERCIGMWRYASDILSSE